jgi:rubrerythrin
MASKTETGLRGAIEMEEEGKQFYLQSAAKVKSILARKIFEELAAEEDHHIAVIKKIYQELAQDKTLNRWVTTAHGPSNLEKIFKESLIEKAKAAEGDLEALRFGLDREQKSITYYETLANETGSFFEKRFYLTLSYEERGHFLRIMDGIEYLTDPAGWLYVSERDMVDGG